MQIINRDQCKNKAYAQLMLQSGAHTRFSSRDILGRKVGWVSVVLLERVVLKVATSAEGRCAEGARVGQHAVLAHFVRAQLAGLHELPIAQFARVRLLASVGARVTRQAVGGVEPLVAHNARMLPLVRTVHLRTVARQVAARAELLAALVALEAHAQVLVFQVRRKKTLTTNKQRARQFLNLH